VATPNPTSAAEIAGVMPKRFSVVRFLRRNPLALIGLVILGLWIFISIAAPLVSPGEPRKQNIAKRMTRPGPLFRFGSDQLGRDVMTRVFYGGRTSLPGGVIVVLAAMLIGTALGAIAGYAGGWVDELIMRLTEVFLAFPTIILAMTIAAALGPSLFNAIIAMIAVWWPGFTRLVRAQVMSIKQREFVEAARALGVPPLRLLVRTILPNCLAPIIVLATTDLGTAILVFAGLSFLGLGPDPSVPEWGRMIADGTQFFDQWWLAAFPGLAIFTVVLAFNFIGDGVRDALDPKLRGE
jgi:peptide/nickel transport system permease protein